MDAGGAWLAVGVLVAGALAGCTTAERLRDAVDLLPELREGKRVDEWIDAGLGRAAVAHVRYEYPASADVTSLTDVVAEAFKAGEWTVASKRVDAGPRGAVDATRGDWRADVAIGKFEGTRSRDLVANETERVDVDIALRRK